VHKAKGTFRKDRHAGKSEKAGAALGSQPEWFASAVISEVEVINIKGRGVCPPAEWLESILAGEWKRLAGIAHINESHATEVQHACILYLRFVLDALGLRLLTSSERQCLHSIYMQLGCTPASQAKVSAPAAAKADDPWDKLG